MDKVINTKKRIIYSLILFSLIIIGLVTFYTMVLQKPYDIKINLESCSEYKDIYRLKIDFFKKGDLLATLNLFCKKDLNTFFFLNEEEEYINGSFLVDNKNLNYQVYYYSNENISERPLLYSEKGVINYLK